MYRFLFVVRPERDQPATQQRIFLISLYALTLSAGSVIVVNLIWGFSRGSPLSQLFQLVFLACLLVAVANVWISHSLPLSRHLTSAGLFLLALFMIFDSGGTRGIGYLYFIISFPLLHMLLGLRWGLVFITLFVVGLLGRHALGEFPPDSILGDSDLQPRLLLAFLVASVIGSCALVYQGTLVRSLSRLAYSDEVTGLASRNRLVEALSQALQGPKPFALMALKLHHFGLVSNHLGMAPGDRALRNTAAVIERTIPEAALAGRWTGTLFLIRLTETNLENLEQIGQSLINETSRPVDLGDEHLVLQPGVAITRYPEDGKTIDRLVANLTTTLARGEDRPGLVLAFDEAAWKAEERRFQLASALEKALPSGQLSLAYQPKVLLATGEPQGAEILLRWNHPELGSVSPAEFIPVAETIGLIFPITGFVIDRFLQDLKDFQRAEVPGPFAINLSSQDLTRKDLAEKVIDRFKRDQVDPGTVELEITEGVMMSEDPGVQRVLAELKSAGFRLAIDDFGTGYSSLSYLHRIDADTLKIDQSFVRQLDSSTAVSSIVDAIISMGKSLGMTIVAEGVETSDQADYLRRRGCTYAQGWHFGRPMAAEVFRDWILTRNKL